MFFFSTDCSPPKAGEQYIITSPWGQCVYFLPAFLFPLTSLSSQFLSSVCYFGLSLSYWRFSSNIRQYLEEVLKFQFCVSKWGLLTGSLYHRVTEQWTELILIHSSVYGCLSCFHIFKIFIVLFGCSGSQLLHMMSSLLCVGSLVASYRLFSCGTQAL